jgi:hypothetical protein
MSESFGTTGPGSVGRGKATPDGHIDMCWCPGSGAQPPRPLLGGVLGDQPVPLADDGGDGRGSCYCAGRLSQYGCPSGV